VTCSTGSESDRCSRARCSIRSAGSAQFDFTDDSRELGP
jgi:hypothetical protein